MIECLDCKKQISISANACPHCGCITENKKNRDSNIKKILFLIVIPIIVLLLLWNNTHKKKGKGFYYFNPFTLMK